MIATNPLERVSEKWNYQRLNGVVRVYVPVGLCQGPQPLQDTVYVPVGLCQGPHPLQDTVYVPVGLCQGPHPLQDTVYVPVGLCQGPHPPQVTVYVPVGLCQGPHPPQDTVYVPVGLCQGPHPPQDTVYVPVGLCQGPHPPQDTVYVPHNVTFEPLPSDLGSRIPEYVPVSAVTLTADRERSCGTKDRGTAGGAGRRDQPPGAAPSSQRLCALTVQVRGRDDAYSVRGPLCLISPSRETPGPDAGTRRRELQSREHEVNDNEPESDPDEEISELDYQARSFDIIDQISLWAPSEESLAPTTISLLTIVRMVTRVNIGLLSAALRLVTRCLPCYRHRWSLESASRCGGMIASCNKGEHDIVYDVRIVTNGFYIAHTS
ncbi:unnamed protein product [Ranitomeya imitator]|uniref:Uncharacterized protein n=1 Tax=Ranitomeya imitator TaxID=111125 RepID=A0ABN9MLL6_9NEOB|nr:unnamed protein product [Ranitomeya imitator]